MQIPRNESSKAEAEKATLSLIDSCLKELVLLHKAAAGAELIIFVLLTFLAQFVYYAYFSAPQLSSQAASCRTEFVESFITGRSGQEASNSIEKASMTNRHFTFYLEELPLGQQSRGWRSMLRSHINQIMKTHVRSNI